MADHTDRDDPRADRQPLFCRQVVRLPIDLLTSWRGGPYRNCEPFRNIDPFDKPVTRTPHYAVLQHDGRPIEECLNEPYVRYYDTLAALGHTTREQGETFSSGLDRLRQFRALHRQIEEQNRIEPIQVTAECDGRFRIRDGQHRAAIARTLGWRHIAGRIVGVDKDVAELLRLLYADWPCRQRSLYQPVEHPVFADWRVTRSEQRWEMMRDAVDWKGKVVLDVGCYTGYFSRQIARRGGRVLGVEAHSKRLAVAQRLDRLLGTGVEYVRGDFKSVVCHRTFDMVLFLSVLHWILRSEGLYGIRQALDAISRAAPVMLLDSAGGHEQKMQTTTWSHGLRLDRRTIPRLVINSSSYTECRHLGEDNLQRDLFIFWRPDVDPMGDRQPP